MKTTKIKLSEITLRPETGRLLPDGFIKRMIDYKEKLKEVANMSLEKTLNGFQRDLNPLSELSIWEGIADLYQYHVVNKWPIERKMQLFKDLLCPPPFDK